MNSLLISDLKRDEGLRLNPYRCPAGDLTIGYGRNLEKLGISLAEAEMLLRFDVERLEGMLRRQPFYLNLSQVRKDVVLNMAFNLGITRLFKFKKMIAALKRSDYESAAREMTDSVWYHQVGERSKRLVYMMRNDARGDW